MRLTRGTVFGTFAGLYLFALSALWLRAAPNDRPQRVAPVQVAATPTPTGDFPVRVWALNPGVDERAPVISGAQPRSEVAPGVWRVARAAQRSLEIAVGDGPRRVLTLPAEATVQDGPATPAPLAPGAIALVTREALPASLESRVAVVVSPASGAVTARLRAEGAVVEPPEAAVDASGVAWFRVRAERPQVRLEASAGTLRVRRTLGVEGQPVAVVAVDHSPGRRRVQLARASADAPLYCDLFDRGRLVDGWTLLPGVASLELPAPPDGPQRLQCTAVLGDASARGDAAWLAPDGSRSPGGDALTAAAAEALWGPAPLTPLAVSASTLEADLRADEEARSARRGRFLWTIGLSFLLIAAVAITRGLRAAQRNRQRLAAAVSEHGDPTLDEGPAASLVRRRSRVELVGMSLVLLLALAALLGLFARL